VAFNGAEPIQQETLVRFTQTFAPCGFRRQSFYPCYGLAEATLMVSCLPRGTLPVIKTVETSALERNDVVEVPAGTPSGRALVSNGKTLPTQQIVIAHPETGTLCKPGEVGEIWVSGPSVAKGYWNNAPETTATFQAYLADTDEGPFLRTGDLGFLDGGELFVIGRLQDLIIILGRNLYPQDLELTVERCHPSLRPGCGAAFSVTVDSEEQLVVAQELEFRQKPQLAEVKKAVRKAVAEEHGMQLHAVLLLRPGSIPKTSSGKIQRNLCKRRFFEGALDLCDDESQAKLLLPTGISTEQCSNPT
jgi:acyl-CoA synthetase (AMP-forming)/AMP-acid ligase II